jgi:uncharacterized protein (DUF983 family)
MTYHLLASVPISSQTVAGEQLSSCPPAEHAALDQAFTHFHCPCDHCGLALSARDHALLLDPADAVRVRTWLLAVLDARFTENRSTPRCAACNADDTLVAANAEDLETVRPCLFVHRSCRVVRRVHSFYIRYGLVVAVWFSHLRLSVCANDTPQSVSKCEESVL